MTKDYPANWRGRQAESLTYDRLSFGPRKNVWVAVAGEGSAANGAGTESDDSKEIMGLDHFVSSSRGLSIAESTIFLAFAARALARNHVDPHSSLYHLLNRQGPVATPRLTRHGVTAFRLFSRHGATHGRAKSFNRIGGVPIGIVPKRRFAT